jgi:N-methylhydantoinase A/oxoprolinase/acetone carboxylase beta subunit
MSTIYVPPHAGVLSALGLAITAERRERIVSVLTLAAQLDSDALGRELVRAAGGVVAGADWDRRWVARARYVGQGHELDVPVLPGENGSALTTRFATLHAQRNGFTLDAPVEVIGVRHLASGPSHPVRLERTGSSQWRDDHRLDDGRRFDARVVGPAVIVLPGATLRIAPGWHGTTHVTGGWILERETPS